MKSILITLLAAMIIGWDTLTIEVAVQQKKSQNDEGKNETTVTQTETEEEEKDFPLDEGQTIYEWNGIRLQSLYPHNRPEGYDNPVLADKTAQMIIQEAYDMQWIFFRNGWLPASRAASNALSAWSIDEKNCVRGDWVGGSSYELRNYFAPEIDTVEKIEKYVALTYTEDSIPYILDYFNVCDYNGKAVGYSIFDVGVGGVAPYWGDFQNVMREDSDDGKESRMQFYVDMSWYGDYELHLSQVYTFVYDETYGWRLRVTSKDEMMNIGY